MKDKQAYREIDKQKKQKERDMERNAVGVIKTKTGR